MVRIRLTRTGRKNAPSYRIIVVDSKAKRDGQYLELIGNYNPTEDDKNVEYKKDRYEYWLSVGAQPSDAVKKLVDGKYVYKPYDRNESESESEEAETEKSDDTSEKKPKDDDNTKAETETNSDETVKTEK